MIGTTVGAYKILDKIGSGGFAQVYLARDTRTNQVVALKILRTEYTDDADFISRFQREAEALQKLPSNPHIVTLHEFGQHNGVYYIAMEYLEGHDLQEVINHRGALAVETALSITAQVAEALQAALQGGVIHRDVKPANVKINPQGVVKIMDFGIARAAESARLTRTGAFVGTPAYVAPEIWEGQPASPQSDVYALGVMLYEMLLGKAPFQATTPAATMRRHLLEPPPPLTTTRPDVPGWLVEVGRKALAKEPAQRYHDAGQMLAAFRTHGQGQSLVDVDTLVGGKASPLRGQTPTYVTPPTRTPAPTARPASRRHSDTSLRLVLGLAALFGLLLIALLGLAIASSQGFRVPFPAAARRSSDTPTSTSATSTAAPTLTDSPALAISPAGASDTPAPSPSATPPATARPSDTPSPLSRTATPSGTPSPMPSHTPAATPSPRPSVTSGPTRPMPTTQPGVLFDFEAGVDWRRGDQPNGSLVQSKQQAHSGASSARLDYTFPSGGNDYVVFLKSATLGGQPNAISAWVYGDGVGHFLNAWIKDNGEQVWQVPLGRVGGSAWRQMAGTIVTGQKWPWSHISGPDNGQVDYPIQFYALVLDDNPDSYSGSGTIYIDDITIWRTDKLPTPAATESASAAVTPQAPLPTVANEARAVTLIKPSNGTLFRQSTIAFEWVGGALQPGEAFLVEIIPAAVNKGGCTDVLGTGGRQYSPALTDHQWTTDINANRGPGTYLPCAGRLEWIVHIKDAAGAVVQSTPRGYFEWNPIAK
ncbi:MAG: protein kinase [Thermoflexales bacterium]|nr:protein kinase [Thermoflexales bacterium]